MKILDILNELAADNSRLAKEAILTREKDNELLKTVFKAAYDPFVNYWLLKIPEYKTVKNPGYTLKSVINFQLKNLSDRVYTGNAGIEYLSNTLADLPKDDAIVIERIIQRDLRVGCSESTANKVWPGLIPTFDVMLAHKDTSGIKYPAICQTKADGGRCHIHYDGTNVTAWSRNGKPISLHDVFLETAKCIMQPGETFDGEIVFYENGKAMDRKKSNGLFNKAVKNTISKAEAEMARFITWDCVDFTSTIPYIDRWTNLECAFARAFDEQLDSKFYLVASQMVASEREVEVLYDEAIAAGEEGVIVKNTMAVWQPKRTKDLGKLKGIEEFDLRVVSWVGGTGKYKGMLGALVCESEDGLLRVNVGSGFSDTERKMPPATYLDKIISGKYNQKIKSKDDNKKWSLFLPRFVEIREDKDTANTLDELK